MFKFSSGVNAREDYCCLLNYHRDLLQQVGISWQFVTKYWIVTFLIILEELKGSWHKVQSLYCQAEGSVFRLSLLFTLSSDVQDWVHGEKQINWLLCSSNGVSVASSVINLNTNIWGLLIFHKRMTFLSCGILTRVVSPHPHIKELYNILARVSMY